MTRATTSGPGDAPHRPADDDNEEVYFEGSPCRRSRLGRIMLCLAIGALLLATPVILGHLAGQVSIWAILGLCLAGILVPCVPLLMLRTTRYRITNYRIDYERGVLGKNIDTLELWHVEDIKFHQSLMDRILGIGTITVISHDESTPVLPMEGLPDPRPLYEMLKQRIIAVKRQRGVVKMDTGT